MRDIVVSVICAAYNHEKFIAEALESFINQETEYAFEVLVNDDASTDKTAEIIRRYEKAYPDIIKPIYQTVNQYGKRNMTLEMIKRAKGKYFAFCEGDDCWTDNHKLQKQISYMESHPDCTLCIHNSSRVTENKNYLSDIVVTKQDRIIPAEEFIRGGGNFCATNSIVGRMELAKNPPEFYINCPFDYSWQIYLSASGYAYCFSDRMSLYRVGVSGSWNESMERNPEQYCKVFTRINKMLEGFNDWSGHKYDATVQDCIKRNTYSIAIKSNNRDLVKDKTMKKWISGQSTRFRSRHVLWVLSPRLFYKIRNHRLKKVYGFNISK